jgi:hypothetical protein
MKLRIKTSTTFGLLIAGFLSSAFGFIPSSRANDWIPSEYSSSSILRETHEIDPHFEPAEILNQGDTPTCYGQSAQFLLQYLFNSSQLGSHQISVIDVLGRGSDQRFLSGGDAFALLHRLKKQSVWVDLPLTIEEVWNFNSEWNSSCATSGDSTLDEKLYESLPRAIRALAPDWKAKIHSRSLGDSPFTVPYLFLSQAIQPASVQLPLYNVHVFDPKSRELPTRGLPAQTSAQNSSDESRSQEEALIQAIALWFQAWPNHPSPMSFSYEKDDESPIHAATLVGVRKRCADREPCVDEWRIRNSWGGDDEGWFEAKPIAEGILKTAREMTYLTPCLDGPQAENTQQEVCSTEILGFSLGPWTEKSQSSPYQASFPFHYLLIAKDQIQFLKKVQKEGPQGTPLNPSTDLKVDHNLFLELSRTLGSDKTLAYLAIEHKNSEVLEWIFNQAPVLLKQKGVKIGNAAHSAVSRNARGEISKLLEKAPDLFLMEDSFGFYPAQIAALNSDLSILEELYRSNPKFLKTKNSHQKSTFDLLKKIDRATYRKLKELLPKKPSWWKQLLKNLVGT